MLPTYGQPIVRSDPQTFPDNIKLFFGDDDDASIVYNGTDLVINPKEVGSGTLKLEGDFDVGGDIFVRDGNGLVVGHPSKITAINASEVQVLGTTGADCHVLIGRWQDSAPAPGIDFLKSRNPTIGLHTIVQDNDVIGLFRFIPDDGVDFATNAADFQAEVDDPSPAVGDIGMAFVWSQMPGGGGGIRETMRLAASGLLTLPEGSIFIQETVNTFMTVGLTINQGANDDDVVTVKSSDVNQAITDFAEADTYGKIAKAQATSGGMKLTGFKDADGVGGLALFLQGYLGEAADAAQSTSGHGVVSTDSAVTDGGTGVAGVAAGGNIFAAKNNGSTQFIVDAGGNLFANGGVASTDMVTLYDGMDDAQLVRAFDIARSSVGAQGLIESRFDDFLKYNEQDLVDVGILGGLLADGGLINVTRLQQLHNGAIWQLYLKLEDAHKELSDIQTAILALKG